MRFVSLGTGVVAVALLLTGTARRSGAQESPGLAVYRQECKSCHGINGTPPARALAQYKKIKSLGDGGFVSKMSVDSIVTILKKGIDKDMKSFTGKLSDAEMHAAAVYIKELAEKKQKA